jgi:hypothetical protein
MVMTIEIWLLCKREPLRDGGFAGWRSAKDPSSDEAVMKHGLISYPDSKRTWSVWPEELQTLLDIYQLEVMETLGNMPFWVSPSLKLLVFSPSLCPSCFFVLLRGLTFVAAGFFTQSLKWLGPVNIRILDYIWELEHASARVVYLYDGSWSKIRQISHQFQSLPPL